jgi:hypothetical protein
MIDITGSAFVADEKIEEAVIVKIKPSCSLCRMKAQQARFFCHIIECSISIIAKKGPGVMPAFA